MASTAYRPGSAAAIPCTQVGRLCSGTATPPMMSIGRNTAWPSACAAGTVSPIIVMSRPIPRNAADASVNAIQNWKRWDGNGVPTTAAAAICSAPAESSSTIAGAEHPHEVDGAWRGRQAVLAPDASLSFADQPRGHAEARAAQGGDCQELAHMPAERRRLVPVERPERSQKHERNRVAVQESGWIAKLQSNAHHKLAPHRGAHARSVAAPATVRRAFRTAHSRHEK